MQAVDPAVSPCDRCIWTRLICQRRHRPPDLGESIFVFRADAGQRPDDLDGSRSFTSLYWIARVLTDAAADGPVIVAFGDSITRGDGTTIDGEQRYPDHLQARLPAAGLGGAVVLNAGLGANRLLRPRVGPPMTERFARDVLGIAEATHVIIMGGLNDIGLPAVPGGPRPTAATVRRRPRRCSRPHRCRPCGPSGRRGRPPWRHSHGWQRAARWCGRDRCGSVPRPGIPRPSRPVRRRACWP